MVLDQGSVKLLNIQSDVLNIGIDQVLIAIYTTELLSSLAKMYPYIITNIELDEFQLYH